MTLTGTRSRPRSTWSRLDALELWIVTALLLVVMVLLPAMAIAITFDVMARYLFNAPTIWVSDASAFGLLWISFLAAPWLVRHDEHVKGEFATDRLGPRGQAVQRFLVSAAGALVMGVVLWQTSVETYSDFVKGVSTTGSWEVPRWIFWAAMPVGSLFTTIEFVRSAWVALDDARRGIPVRGDGGTTVPEAI